MRKKFLYIIVYCTIPLIINSKTVENNMDQKTPSYVVINEEKQSKKVRQILRHKGELISFPLSEENQAIIRRLKEGFEQEENCAGLASPQIGYGKQIIIFSAPDDPALKKWRPDLSDTMPTTIWINPTYIPIGDEQTIDWERCFSVNDQAGKVARFNQIRYTAYLLDGKKVTGVVSGFLARVIQHEVDHVHGILFIDKVADGQIITFDEYYAMRKNAESS